MDVVKCSCLDKDVKAILVDKLKYEVNKNIGLSEKFGLAKGAKMAPLMKAALDAIESLPECINSIQEEKTGSVDRGKKARRRSGYQKFTSDCLRKKKEAGEKMVIGGPHLQECAANWQKLPEAEKTAWKTKTEEPKKE